ncbi:kinase-like domain-containing protein [Cokeromyces recurvatus]|uniref:kinase-like domain-containing protein n=1 Tax=Cokeromyces recurvatus TaxID=90255 RepID=UPI00221FF90B|nr:kinase-like domain-containing protein [Cokeromyces recurvatus]KAI7904944.1 kinase-like domain-containing protein [Cokeromyces recurvatus]
MQTSSIQAETMNTSHASSEHEYRKQSRKVIGKYFLSKTLGKGSMGKVKLALNADTNERLAVKIIPRKFNTTPNMTRKREKNRELRTIREANIMLLLDHPYIAKVYEMALVDDFYYLFMEYVDGGQLLDYIISHGRLKEKHARHIARQIASALDYCHRNSIVHRDLKVENILISSSGDIKIIDFGLSNLFSPDSYLSTFCGSLYFAAPELLEGRTYIGPEVDIWSFGVVIYILVTGQVPFDDPTIAGMHNKVKQGHIEYPSYLSTDCKSLLQRMLCTNRKKRATLSEVIMHPWMNKGYDCIVDNYLPERKPLELPIDMNIVRGMQGFKLGSEEAISEELKKLITSTEYQQHSESEPYHPLISIYYLIKEHMERNDKASSVVANHKVSSSSSSSSIENTHMFDNSVVIHDADNNQGRVQVSSSCPTNNNRGTTQDSQQTDLLFSPPPYFYDSSNRSYPSQHRSDDTSSKPSTPSNLFRRLSRRFSRQHAIPIEDNSISFNEKRTTTTLNNHTHLSSPETTPNSKLDRFLRRAKSITIKDIPSIKQQQQQQQQKQLYSQRRKSMMSYKEIHRKDDEALVRKRQSNEEHPSSRDLLDQNNSTQQPQADHIVHSVYVKGLFSVSTTSTKKASEIRLEIINILHKQNIKYREMDDRFECVVLKGGCIKFDIYIVKIPWLLGMRGLQFRRTSGDSWQYKDLCRKILDTIRL